MVRVIVRCERPLRVVGAAVLATLMARPASAQDNAPSKASCAEAYETAQERRASGQLQETREKLAFCAHEQCPSFVQKDCARWLTEVERELPSITLTASGIDPAEAATLDVSIDGKVVSGALNGSPISLDPGRHELVIERPGQAPMTRIIMAQQGVQNRRVRIDFATATPPPDADTSSAADSGATLEPLAYAAWGLGAIGLGVFAVVGTLGNFDEEGLRQDCPMETSIPDQVNVAAGICDSRTVADRRSSYETEFVVADVGLIAGIGGLAAGTVLFVLSKLGSSEAESNEAPVESDAGLRFELTPTQGGAWGSVQGHF